MFRSTFLAPSHYAGKWFLLAFGLESREQRPQRIVLHHQREFCAADFIVFDAPAISSAEAGTGIHYHDGGHRPGEFSQLQQSLAR